jgi:hypothetical protein
VIQAVTARKISRDAGWLYACLLSHLNRKRGGNVVWPSRAILASEMGISKPANVDKYLAELETQGLVAVERSQSGQMRTRNIYTLRCLPDLRRNPNVGTTAGESAGQHVVPESGQRSPNVGTRVVPTLGPEQEEEEPDEDSSSHPSTARERIAAVTGCADDEIEPIIESIRAAAARPIRHLGAYLRNVSDEDLHERFAAVRAGSAKQAATKRAADLAELRRHIESLPDCQHGTPGGWYPDPRTGDPWFCLLCRNWAAARPDEYAAKVSAHGVRPPRQLP